MCVHGPWLLRGAPAKETGLCSNLYYSCYITQTAIELENLFLFNCACYTGKASTFLPSDLQTWNTSILFQVQRFLMTGCSRISLKSVNNLFFFLSNNVTVTLWFQLLSASGFSTEWETFLWWQSEPHNTMAAEPANINESSARDTKQLCVMLLWHLFFAREEPSNYQSIWEFPGDRRNCQL